MRRMPPKPMELIECEYEINNNSAIVYVPIMSLNDLPVKFDLFCPSKNYMIPVVAYESINNGEVYAFGNFTDNLGNLIHVAGEPDSIISPEVYPKLTLNLSIIQGDSTIPVIDEGEKLFMANLVHMPKIPLL